MKYYKAPNSEVFAIGEDQEFLVKPDWRELIGSELEAHLNPPPAPLTAEDIEMLRKAAYTDEADPLFFKSHRGEATEKEWLDKIAEIKVKYPKP